MVAPANALAAVLLLAAACGGRGASADFPGRGAQVHAILPSIDGGDLDLGVLRGQVVVLHFFTTWSLAAQVDVAELRRARDAMPPGSTMIIGIGLDPDGPRLVRPWRKAVGADWPIVLPSDQMTAGESGLGKIRVVPTTVVLDGRGRLAWKHEGGLPPGELQKVVRNVERRGAVP